MSKGGESDQLGLVQQASHLFKVFIYSFSERGKEGERKGEKERERKIYVWLPLMCPLLGTWLATQACTLTGNGTDDPSVHSLALNPLSHTSQGCFFFKVGEILSCLFASRKV